MRHAVTLLLLVLVAPGALAHGDLEINELETLAIRDFEGMEDSFPWGGFEIWDVYVGDGYNETLDSEGVYLKVNFAGAGTNRPPGQSRWDIRFDLKVGDEAFERTITHDGSQITSDFESLQWVVADGNVLQVKAWVPVENATGKSVKDIVILTSVDGDPRDVAPGGVYAPAAGAEAPVQAPASPVFPPMGEGRLVDEVPVGGSAKYLNVTKEEAAPGVFLLTATNPLKEQGQHVMLVPRPTAGWNLSTQTWGASLNASQSATFNITLRPEMAGDGLVPPLRIDLVSDIGGRQSYYAFLDGGAVMLTDDAAQAHAVAFARDAARTPGLGVPVVVFVVVALASWRQRG